MKLTKPDEGWAWVVMMASFTIHSLNAGMLYGTGVIQVSLIEMYGESLSVTSWAGAIYIFLMFGAGILGSVIINRYSCRVAFITGSLIMTSGLVASSFARSLHMVIVTYGFIAGLGSGIVFTSGIVVVGLNFVKKRTIATGFASCGAGVGSFVFPPLIQMARDEYGDRGLFFILASMTLNICVFGALCYPSYLEYFKNPADYGKSNISLSLEILSNRKSIYKLSSEFKIFPFICVCLSLLSSHIGIFMIYVHIPYYAISRGSSEVEASLLLSVSGVMNCLSRFLVGIAGHADNISNTLLYFGTFGVLGLTTVFFSLYGTEYVGLIVYAVFLGTYSGSCYVLLSSMLSEIVGLQNLVFAFGLAMIFTGAGTLVGPPLAGFLVDGGVTYETTFTLAGCCILLAALFGAAAEVFRKLHSSEDVPQISQKHDFKSVKSGMLAAWESEINVIS